MHLHPSPTGAVPRSPDPSSSRFAPSPSHSPSPSPSQPQIPVQSPPQTRTQPEQPQPPPPPPPPLVRTDFYFPDGNIVLLVPPCVFKVHKGQLGRHSEVFDGMFDIPQPSLQPPPQSQSVFQARGMASGNGSGVNGNGNGNGGGKARSRAGSLSSQQGMGTRATTPCGGKEERGGIQDELWVDSYDGCQVVRLWDDPQDVYYFLKALYDGLYVPPTPSPTTFPIISAILRLSTKYIVPHLRRICITHLVTYWPSTLHGWDVREQLATFPFSPIPVPSSQSTSGPSTATVTMNQVPGGGGTGQTPVNPPIPFSVPVGIINQPIQPHTSFFLPNHGLPSSSSSSSSSGVYPHPLTITTGRYTPREFYTHPIQIILLALELDIPELLASAFYDLSRYGPSKIMAGVFIPKTTFENFVEWNSVVQGVVTPGDVEAKNEGNKEDTRTIKLNPFLLRRTLRGRERGQAFFTRWVHETLANRKPSPRCLYAIRPCGLTTPAPVATTSSHGHGTTGMTTTTATTSSSGVPTFGVGGYWQINLPIQNSLAAHSSFPIPVPPGIVSRPPTISTPSNAQVKEIPCLDSFSHIHLNLLRSITGISHGRDADPLYTLLQAIDMLYRTDFSDGERVCGLRMCEECKKEFVDEVREARAVVWREIPRWFGLDGDGDGDGDATTSKGTPDSLGGNIGVDSEAVRV